MTTPTQSDEEATLQQHIEAILDGFSTGISDGQIGGQGIMYKYNSEEDTSKAPEALIAALWCLFRDKAEQELEAVKREYWMAARRAKDGTTIGMDYTEGHGPAFSTLETYEQFKQAQGEGDGNN